MAADKYILSIITFKWWCKTNWDNKNLIELLEQFFSTFLTFLVSGPFGLDIYGSATIFLLWFYTMQQCFGPVDCWHRYKFEVYKMIQTVIWRINIFLLMSTLCYLSWDEWKNMWSIQILELIQVQRLKR